MICIEYFIEWEFRSIIPLSADRGISVGAFISGGTIQGVPGGKDLTSEECSLGQTIPI